MERMIYHEQLEQGEIGDRAASKLMLMMATLQARHTIGRRGRAHGR